MKKTLTVFFGILCGVLLYSNDTYFTLAGGTLVPTSERENTVQMRSEQINIDLYDEYYEVTVDFVFYNPGETRIMPVGFPFFYVGTEGSGKIYDFSAWTNGIKTDCADMPLQKKWQSETKLEKAYVRQIEFSGQNKTETRISYKSDYGRESPSFRLVSYLYGTGSSWVSEIEQIRLCISNRSDWWIYSIQMPGVDFEGKIKWINNTSFETIISYSEPEYTDSIFIRLCPPLFDVGPRILPRTFEYTDIKISTRTLDLLRKDQLRLLRNVFYALHGYVFKNKDLAEYFGKTDWYRADNNFSESAFTGIEKANIDKILGEEKKR